MYTLYSLDSKEPTPVVTVDYAKKTINLISPTLLKVMSTTGINVPAVERPNYHDKVCVLVGEPEFYDAFTKIYVPVHYPMGKPGYEWRTWTAQ